MKFGWIIAIGVAALLAVGALVVFGTGVSYYNKEKRLHNLITNKIKANQSDLDAVKKSIIQSANVTEEGADLIVRAIQANASGRDGGSLFKSVQEAVPNVDLSLHKNLMNIITGSRETFSTRQKELLQLKTEHDNIVDQFPGSIVGMIFGWEKIDVPIVTSTAVQEAFATGKDDDTELFKRKSNPAVEKR